MQQYSSAFTADKTYKHELHKVLNLLSEGNSESQTRDIILTNNLFQLSSERAIKDTLNKVFRRAHRIQGELISYFMDSTNFDKQAIYLYSFLQAYRLPREFVMEVVYFTFHMGQKVITLQDIDSFFERKAEENEVVRAWSKETKAKLRQVTLQTLKECEVLKKVDMEFHISPILISPQLREYSRQLHPALLRYTLNE
jgi:chemotaxis protein histidine kinase CheA